MMTRLRTERNELDVTVTGEGEPVLMIHGGLLVDTFEVLRAEPALADNFKLISYHRHGHGRSSRGQEPYSVANSAADAADVLREVGAERAHVVGHSRGGADALQLALDHPEAVQSLALLEAAVPTQGIQQVMEAVFTPVADAYSAGDRSGAVQRFCQGIGGEHYREVLDRALPVGWFEQAMADVDTLFTVDLPRFPQWVFGEAQARQISQPVLLVVGGESPPAFHDHHETLKKWFPQAEEYVLPGADHLQQMANPGDMAQRLASFAAAHPIEAYAGRADR